MLTDEDLRDWDRGIKVGLPVWSNGRGRRRPRGTGYWRTCAGSGGIWYGWRAASLGMLMSGAGVVIRRVGLLYWRVVELRLLIALMWRVLISWIALWWRSLIVMLRRVLLLLLLLTRRMICEFLELFFALVEQAVESVLERHLERMM
jgi:hypothetical protein